MKRKVNRAIETLYKEIRRVMSRHKADGKEENIKMDVTLTEVPDSNKKKVSDQHPVISI